MKVHITFVGGQTSPVYLGISATNPDFVVFICSSNSKNQVPQIVSEIKGTNIKYEISEPLEATDPKPIQARAEELKQRFSNDEIVVNISSGTKSWSHIFGRVFDGQSNAKIIYIDQNNYLWDYQTMEGVQIQGLDIARMFRLNNNVPSSFHNITEYTPEDAKVRDEIIVARDYHKDTFKTVTQVLKKDPKSNKKMVALLKEKKGETPKGSDGTSYASWNRETNTAIYHLAKSKKGPKEFVFQSPHAVDLLFNSGWFEYYIADILAHWEYSKEVFMNLIFPPQKTNQKDHPKNEIDIVVSTGVKYLFVECKTGIYSSTDIDKFHSAVQAYGGRGNKELFITENKMDAIALEKCKNHHIIPFSLNSYKTREEAFKDLFIQLSKELTNINI